MRFLHNQNTKSNKFFREPSEPFPFEPRLVPFTLNLINSESLIPASSAKVLDCGSGFGRLVNALRNEGVSAYGCDTPDSLQAVSDVFRLISLSAFRLPFEDNSIDVVLTNSILEHVQRSSFSLFRNQTCFEAWWLRHSYISWTLVPNVR